MAEDLHITDGTKEEKYRSLIPQIESLLDGEKDLIANLANVTAVLKEAFGFFWIGFYFVKKDQLVLGPFQGPVACTRIGFGRGVCGTSWKSKETIVVPDVELFPGHIACSSRSRSEIVVPVFVGNEIKAVLDIDSEEPDTFDHTYKKFLEEICNRILSNLEWI